MNDEQKIERIKKVIKLKPKEILILNKRKQRTCNFLLSILYFSAVLFCFKLSIRLFITSIESKITIFNIHYYISSLILMMISFLFYYIDYAIVLLFGLFLFFIYEKLLNPNKDIEQKLIRRIKNG